ncbi:MAG: DUF4837 family protein [Paludibacteraceae bacterium]|nr:DUF4837 family protein [Paludibacteraceae bacterium]
MNRSRGFTLNMTGIVFMAMLVFFASGCSETGRTLPSATGSIYEVVVVADDDAAGNAVKSVMEADMPCLPQMEPYFNVTHVTPKMFDDFLKSARNVLMVETNSYNGDSINTPTVKALYSRNRWSKPQAVCRITSPSKEMFIDWWKQNGEQIRDWFVGEELARATRFLRGDTNKEARTSLTTRLDCDMLIPTDYMLIKDTTDLVWCCNNKGSMRRDIVVYRYPYTDAGQFSQASLCAKRDEVMGQLVSASVAGSYMGTEYNIFPPQMRSVQPVMAEVYDEGASPHKKVTDNQSFYAYETRGLWRIFNGEAMGGPYVSLTRLDPVNGQIVTAEVFIYAAGQKKRNAIRQAESILYTLQLPHEK